MVVPGARFGPGSALRPRKRLAAVGVAAIGPPAEFLLDPTLAEKDPFDAADRMTGREDPFLLADDQIKMPTLPFEPMPNQDQVGRGMGVAKGQKGLGPGEGGGCKKENMQTP